LNSAPGLVGQLINHTEVRYVQRSSPTAGGVQEQKEDEEKPSGFVPLGFFLLRRRLSRSTQPETETP
jgi:hypothetical protein